ncbi:MAG: hypothetical protein BWY10_01595 [Chloroflexi bacterium ADurb.Bin180]|nr:MAG: hypothetical protein BWY10_01595 [Chloroflexi bacterium ADurb.Bin180]
MFATVSRYVCVKAGNQPDECEDAFCIRGVRRGPTLRCAVADGATESSFSRAWATRLVHAYARRPFDDLADLVKRAGLLGRGWRRVFLHRPLPWYAAEKVRLGAFSTLLGTELARPCGDAAKGTWRAVAVGDTCLFHLRGAQLLAVFPPLTASDFGHFPTLLSTSEHANVSAWAAVLFTEGEWQVGDTFVLATDALAAWFARIREGGAATWAEFPPLAEHLWPAGGFEDWVFQKRASKELANDDTTCIVVQTQEMDD